MKDCKCDLRTKLVGDGCEVCNPELALDCARAEIEELRGYLKDIGDWAHDRSTGPAIQDDLWEIRRMAYDAL